MRSPLAWTTKTDVFEIAFKSWRRCWKTTGSMRVFNKKRHVRCDIASTSFDEMLKNIDSSVHWGARST